jgi:hypothetical protein
MARFDVYPLFEDVAQESMLQAEMLLRILVAAAVGFALSATHSEIEAFVGSESTIAMTTGLLAGAIMLASVVWMFLPAMGYTDVSHEHIE